MRGDCHSFFCFCLVRLCLCGAKASSEITILVPRELGLPGCDAPPRLPVYARRSPMRYLGTVPIFAPWANDHPHLSDEGNSPWRSYVIWHYRAGREKGNCLSRLPPPVASRHSSERNNLPFSLAFPSVSAEVWAQGPWHLPEISSYWSSIPVIKDIKRLFFVLF